MNKIKGVIFLLKCVGYVMYRLLRARTWNSITVNLEQADGSRQQLTYMKTTDGFALRKFP